jgi:hypothetical protein
MSSRSSGLESAFINARADLIGNALNSARCGNQARVKSMPQKLIHKAHVRLVVVAIRRDDAPFSGAVYALDA